MKLNSLSLNDQELFSQRLGSSRHELSTYNFNNIYIWKSLFEIKWSLIEENLCVFFQDKISCFLYLDPSGGKKSPVLIEKIFKTLDNFNRNPDFSRIENIEENNVGFYRGLGYDCRDKFGEYLCSTEDLVGLKGNRYKSKRAAVNFFSGHYKYEYLPFELEYKEGCIDLYMDWMKSRQSGSRDPVYLGMLQDSLSSLRNLLADYRDLDCLGRIVKVNGELRAFTFGFELNPETFCVLYEVTDLSVKGLSQFIFQRFSADMRKYRYINIMDDSGLDNLKVVKQSYHPARMVSNYIIQRKK